MRTILVAVTMAVGWACTTDKGPAGDAGNAKPAPPPLPVMYLPADPPPRAFTVHAVINNGAERVIYRGHPATIRGGASALGLDASVPLTEESLALTITAADGGAQAWNFERLTPPRPGLVLTGLDFGVHVKWLLDETKTAQLQPGKYSLRFAWAGESTDMSFEVVDPPSAPTADWQESRVKARIRILLSQKRTPEALALTTQALSTWPTSTSLLNLKALTLEQAGDLRGALDAAGESVHQWRLQNPGKKLEYFNSTRDLYNRLFDEVVLKGILP